MQGRSGGATRLSLLAAALVGLVVLGGVALVVHASLDKGPISTGVQVHHSGGSRSSGSPKATNGHPPVVGTVPSTTTTALPLSGKVVVLDPGHNGGNFSAPSVINQLIWNGREMETCDTTGTETDDGYTESRFNFAVATLAMADLQAEGATVVLTRTTDSGVGPCVTQRAAIGNDAHADAAVSIHADGGPPTGRGFAILLPVDDTINTAIVAPSHVLGVDLRAAFSAATTMPISTYDGVDGLQPRDDLAGINLSTVPKVFIECGNMRNSVDADLLTNPVWQAKAAQGIAAGLTAFLTSPDST